MPEYNNLEATDTMVVNSGENSYSVTVADVADGAVLEDTDLFLVNRGENSYSITKKQLAEEIAPDGVITPPVVVRTPPNGAGMADGEVTPAAEGITGLVESTVIAPTYSSTLTVEVGNADSGTTAVNAFDGDTAKEFRGTIASTMVWDASSYGITVANSLKIHTLSLKGSGDSNVAISINGAVLHNTNTADQNTNYGTAGTVNIPFTGDLNEVRFVATGSAGTYFYAIYVDDEVLIDGGVTNNATLTYTTDKSLSLLAEGQSMTQQPAYTPVTDTITNVSGSAPTVELTFDSPKDLVNFRPGDVVQGIDSTETYKIYSFPTNTQPPVDAKLTWTLIEETSITNGPQLSQNHFGFIYELDTAVSSLHLGFIPDNQANLVLKLWGSNDATNWTTLDCVNTGTTGTGVYADSGSTPYKYFCFAKISESGEIGLCSNGTNTVTVSMNNVSYAILSNQNPAVKVISTGYAQGSNTMVVDGGTWSNGETVTGPVCQGTGEYVSHTANTLELTNAGGRWVVSPDVAAESDDTYTDAAPGWDSTTFQSGNGPDSSIEFDGENCNLIAVKWTIEESAGDKDGDWPDVGDSDYDEKHKEYTDILFPAVEVNQQVPKLDQEVTLTPGKFHRVKVQYTADSGADPVESDWNYFKASEDEKPQGVQMSGLRFDGARATSLNTTLAAGDVSKWTFSCWIKPTSFAEPNVILNAGGTNAGAASIMVLADGKVQFESDSATQIVSSTALSLNNWSHIVVSFDNGNASLSINELNETASSKTSTKINSSINHIIGRQLSRWNVNGYMSDVYFVDGQALESSAFGKDYAGLWGPIPSETVLNNITRDLSPYDERPNMDEEWSVNVSTDNGEFFKPENGPEYAFDGNTSTPASSKTTGNNGWIEFTTTVPLNSKISVFTRLRNTIDLNGTEIRAQTSDATTAWSEEYDCSGATTIRVYGYGPTSGTAEIYAVKVNGRLLIDGPADNSQNWSDSLSSAGGFTGNAYGPKAGFDNDTTTFCQANTSTDLVWTPATPITVTSKIEMFTKSNSAYNNKILINGVDTGVLNLPGGGGAGSYKDLNFTGTLTSLTITGGASSSGFGNSSLYGLRIDDKVLVDAGAQWDTSQVWSEGASGGINRPGFDPSNAFDGDLTTFFNSDDTESAVFSFTNLTIQSSLRLFCRGANGNLAVTLSGVQQPITTDSGDAQWRSASVTGPVDFTSIDIAGSQIGLYAVEVDGKLLVDAGSMGSNGFYLPFDPSAEGVNYTSSIVSTIPSNSYFYGTLNGGGFNAQPGDYSDSGSNFFGCANAASGSIVVSINEDYSSSIKMYGYINAQGSISLKIDGTDYSITNLPTSSNGQNIPLTTISGLPNSGTLESITIQQPGSGGTGFTGIYLDDKLLVNHNSIGADASGNGNNFHDQNFAVGNTSQVWSKFLTNTAAVNPSQYMFNGFVTENITGASYTIPKDVAVGTIGWELNYPEGVFTNGTYTIEGSKKTEIKYLVSLSNGTTIDTTTLTIADKGDNTKYPIAIPDGVSLTKIEAYNQGTSSGNTNGHLFEGKYLVDGNIPDTVVDTPVKNYAVLQSGTNGNLSYNGSPTNNPTQIFKSGSFYAEMTYTGGAADSSRFVSLGGCKSVYQDPPYLDGVFVLVYEDHISFRVNAKEESGKEDEANIPGDLFAIAIKENGETKIYKNGNQIYLANANPIADFNWMARGNGPTATYNFGQQPFVAPNVTHDLNAGTVVIDGVTYDTLYKELEGYQVAGGYFYDEKNQRAVRGSDLRKRFGITSADPQLGIYDLTEVPSHQVIGYEKVGSKYQALRDYTPEVRVAQAETTAVTAELTEAQATITAQRQMIIRAACTWVVGKAYEEGDIILFNGHVFKALTATTATADNDPGDETGDWEFLGLEEDTAPTVIDGYYPLYTTEAASNAAGNGSSHTHTFDGVTYYMPNGGTTIYHGTYTGYSY